LRATVFSDVQHAQTAVTVAAMNYPQMRRLAQILLEGRALSCPIWDTQLRRGEHYDGK
jgi:hypothetical protein